MEEQERRWPSTGLVPPSPTLKEEGYIEGVLIRKKRRRDWYQLAIKETPKTMCQDVWVAVSSCTKQQLFLESVVRIEGCQPASDDEERKSKWIGSTIRLVTCAANPMATKALLDNEQLSLEYLKSVLLPPNAPEETAEKLEQLLLDEDEPIKPSQNAWLVRVLDGRENDHHRSRRAPKISRQETTALENLEATVDLFPLVYRAVPKESLPLPVHLSDADEKSRRLHYLARKKHPQISWMVHRLELLCSNRTIRRIVDVGGGRGDFARALATAFPSSLVTVVDTNASSLTAGRAWCAPVTNMRFVNADFATVSPDPQVDLVVALHACGGLSDLALQYADACQADFCVCPCCYTKMQKRHDGLADLHRLAELNEGCQLLPRRARRVINSKRLRDLEARYETVTLEEFNPECSMRNMVLVGKRKQGS